ncbi:MAG TPA: helix-turn-helix domain-containing protein [Candidatus Dormibacteraeota bacterium]|nr:helix-turn-helix domain-containing protein [Candidatus Dormibacteraeota bacterium]
MNRRQYRLGRRQASVDRTAAAILEAARQLIAGGEPAGVGAIARRAGVSRITVYNRFGSRAGLLEALAPQAQVAESDAADPRDRLRLHFERTSLAWAASPGLFRHLPGAKDDSAISADRAQTLAAADALRPGCSIREAEDVISALSCFAVFDRLHKDGRRPPAAVSDILMRLAHGILA